MTARPTKPHGIALLLTLTVALFLLILLGAFLVVNRGNSALTVSGLARQKAYNSCLSGLHYVWGELELNQGWGAGGFANGVREYEYPEGAPKMRIRVHGDNDSPEDLEKNYVEGEFLETAESFRVTLVNNLQKREVLEDTGLGNVPGRSTRVQVMGKSGSFQLSLDSILRKQPYVDYSAVSSETMSIELENSPANVIGWELRSKDPYVNQVRSNTEVLGPSALDRKIVFSDPPRGGLAKATDDIKLAGTSVKSDPDFLTQSESMAKGSFQVGAAPIDVPGLSKDDLRFPDNSLQIPGGTLTLRAIEKHSWSSRDFQVDTSFPADGVPDTTVTRWRLKKEQRQALQHNDKIWVAATSTGTQDSGPLNSVNDGFPAPTSSDGFQDVPSQPSQFSDVAVLYGNDPKHQVKANLTTGEIALTSATTFNVNGSLSIVRGEGSKPPNLLFGYTMDDGGETEFSAGLVGGAAIEKPEANSAALVSNGSLEIDGVATGFGSIYAQDAVMLKAKSGMRAQPDLAVAVHGRSIRFAAEDPPDESSANSLLDADFEFFREAMGPSGFDNFEDWNDKNATVRRRTVGDDPDLSSGLRTANVKKNASYMWSQLDKELHLGPEPNFSSPPFGSEWNGNLTLEHYIRLREYARTKSQSWLDRPGPGFQSVVGEIDSQIGTYSRWASLMGVSVEDFMSAEQPEIADVFFVGLVHAGDGGFYADTNGASLLVEGSVVSQGGLSVSGGPKVDFVYNRNYLDDVIRPFRDDHITLDQVYFKLN